MTANLRRTVCQVKLSILEGRNKRNGALPGRFEGWCDSLHFFKEYMQSVFERERKNEEKVNIREKIW